MTEHIETNSRNKPTFFGSAVFFMVCLVAIFSNIAFGGVSTGILGITTILVGLLVMFWLIDSWKAKQIKFSTNFLLLPFVALILIGLIQILPLSSPDVPSGLLQTSPVSSLSLDPYSTRFAILKLIIYLVFFAAALTFINSQKRLRKTVVTIIVFGAVMGFFGVMQWLGNPGYIYGIREVGQAVPFASYVNQHHFAAFMELTIGLSLGLLFGGGRTKDKLLLLVIAVFLMGIAIVFTGSRGGFISLIGVIAFLLAMNIFYRKSNAEDAENVGATKPSMLKRNLAMVGGSVILIGVLLFSVVWLGGGDLALRGTGVQVNQTDFTSGRTHFWGVAINVVQDSPVLGSGLEAFGVAYTKHDTWNGQFRVEHAHNDYLQILADAGILGLLCVIAFLILFFRQAFKVVRSTSDSFRRNVAIGAMAGCFGIMVHSIFDFPLRTNANMFFFLILVALAVVSVDYPKLYRKRIKVKTKKAA